MLLRLIENFRPRLPSWWADARPESAGRRTCRRSVDTQRIERTIDSVAVSSL